MKNVKSYLIILVATLVFSCKSSTGFFTKDATAAMVDIATVGLFKKVTYKVDMGKDPKEKNEVSLVLYNSQLPQEQKEPMKQLAQNCAKKLVSLIQDTDNIGTITVTLVETDGDLEKPIKQQKAFRFSPDAL